MPLSKSDRINVVSEAAYRLANESWQLIDLTLKTFGLPTADQWGGTQSDYILEMMSDASDEALVGIAHHIGIDISDPKGGIDPPFWNGGDLRVFISHLASHKKEAGELQEALGEYNMCGFVAHKDIEPTKEWQNEIETALETCEVMVVLLHKGFGHSNWTDQEVGFAMGRHLPILTVKFDEDPHGFIGKFQAFNGSGKGAEAIAEELYAALCTDKTVQVRMEDVIVRLFEESGSFIEAKQNMARLAAIEHWQHDYSDRLKKAVETNSQIAGAWGVPEGIERLLKKWEQGT